MLNPPHLRLITDIECLGRIQDALFRAKIWGKATCQFLVCEKRGVTFSACKAALLHTASRTFPNHHFEIDGAVVSAETISYDIVCHANQQTVSCR